jgi:CheY-like chemotaxis protein
MAMGRRPDGAKGAGSDITSSLTLITWSHARRLSHYPNDQTHRKAVAVDECECTGESPAKYRLGRNPGGMTADRESMNVLIVDDDPAIREISARILSRAGFTVNVAEDGQAGWEAVELQHYDLIITDQNMPRLEGTEFIGRLHGAGHKMPVIMITGAEMDFASPENAPDCLLTKPFHFPVLLDQMNRLLCMATSRVAAGV